MPARRPPPDVPSHVEVIRWSQLRPKWLARWEQGEHIAIIGPTGQGKTTLMADICEGRAQTRGAHIVMFANKRRDATATKLGWPIIPDWDHLHYEHRVRRKVILWPPYGKASTSAAKNRRVFVEALDGCMEEGGWGMCFDEMIYWVQSMRLRINVDEFWNGARSNGNTLIGSSQGVSWIPRAMTSQESWLVLFRIPDRDVRMRAAEIAGDKKTYEPLIDRLGPHEFLLVNTRTDEGWISKVGT